MSRPLRVAVACEGPTDFIVIEAVLQALLPPEADFVRPTRLHPPEPSALLQGEGQHGGGWKGVRGWIRATQAAFAPQDSPSTLLQNFDLLIIHIDADVADDKEINCARACPPPSATTDALIEVLAQWAGVESLTNPRVVLCLPSKATESWLCKLLLPDDRRLPKIE